MEPSPTRRANEHSSIQLTVENLAQDFNEEGYHDTSQYFRQYGLRDYDNATFTNAAYRSSSPNNDSAIENTSPSSISSGSYIEQPAYRPFERGILEADQDGVNRTAENGESPPRENNLGGSRYDIREMRYGNPPAVQSYYGADGVAVSQI